MHRKLYLFLCSIFSLLTILTCTTEEPLRPQKDLKATLLGTWYNGARCPPSQCFIFKQDSFICYDFSDTFGFSDSLIHVNLKREIGGTWRILPDQVDPDIQYAYGRIELTQTSGYKEVFTAAGYDTAFCFTKDSPICTKFNRDSWYFKVFKDYGHGLVINDTL
jgi:hypothetical protein